MIAQIPYDGRDACGKSFEHVREGQSSLNLVRFCASGVMLPQTISSPVRLPGGAIPGGRRVQPGDRLILSSQMCAASRSSAATTRRIFFGWTCSRGRRGARRRLILRTNSYNGSDMLVKVRENVTGMPADKIESNRGASHYRSTVNERGCSRRRLSLSRGRERDRERRAALLGRWWHTASRRGVRRPAGRQTHAQPVPLAGDERAWRRERDVVTSWNPAATSRGRCCPARAPSTRAVRPAVSRRP